jgi:hypothetical protein
MSKTNDTSKPTTLEDHRPLAENELGRPNAELRTREYLTDAEVARLLEAARSNRWGHRDATMVPVRYTELSPDRFKDFWR